MSPQTARIVQTPPCPAWCASCVNPHTAPHTDAGTARHSSQTITVTDGDDGENTVAVVTVEQFDDPRALGEPRVYVEVAGSLSTDKAEALIAALTAQVQVAEAATRVAGGAR